MKNNIRAVLMQCGLVASFIPALFLLGSAPFLIPVAQAAEVINVWWPTSGSYVTGTQPFKAMVPGLDVSQYEMFWQVDNGQWNGMDSSYQDYPHKEASVNLSSWNWRGVGPYTVTYIARRSGVVLATYPTTVYIGSAAPAPVAVTAPVAVVPTPAPLTPQTPSITAALQAVQTVLKTPVAQAAVSDPAPVATVVAPPVANSNPLSGQTFYVDRNSRAAEQARAWQTAKPNWATMMQYLAAQPTAQWLGEWNADVASDVRASVSRAQAAGTVPTFIAYAIPQRDCGGYSSGGTNNPNAYASWIDSVASGIGSGKAVVVLEPDALAQITCLSNRDQTARLSLIGNAVKRLKQNNETRVYIDAGHSGWVDASTMASRLGNAGLSAADGFALNVSNFMQTADELTYGNQISAKSNGKHFVVDTARNGNGSNGQWCNPSGRAVGARPTTDTGNSLVDAFLWLKVPGESDGNCNGGPSAGTWWSSYALELVQNAHLNL